MNSKKNAKQRETVKTHIFSGPGKSSLKQIAFLWLRYFIVAMVIAFIAGLQIGYCLHWFIPSLYISLITIVIIVILFVYCMRILNKINPYFEGLKGERVVSQSLDKLKKYGCKVYNDLQGENFNVDHVLLSKNGIYVIETKVRNRSGYKKPELKYDGKKIIFPNGRYEVDPIGQVRANAKWFREKFLISKNIKIYSIVLYVDWYVQTISNNVDVKVLNQDQFANWIERLENTNDCSLTQLEIDELDKRILREREHFKI